MVYDGTLDSLVRQPSTAPNDPSTGGTGFGVGGPGAAGGYGASGTGAAGMGAAGSGATGTGAEEAGSYYDAASGAGHEGEGKTGTGDQLGSLVGDIRSSNNISSPTRLSDHLLTF